MPATPNELRIIRRAALGGAALGFVYAAVGIVSVFSKNAVSGVLLAVSLPIWLFLPVGAGAIIGCLVGWVYCLALRKK